MLFDVNEKTKKQSSRMIYKNVTEKIALFAVHKYGKWGLEQ